MDLDWLKDFLALAEQKNFSRAADARNVSQPAFSRRIRYGRRYDRGYAILPSEMDLILRFELFR